MDSLGKNTFNIKKDDLVEVPSSAYYKWEPKINSNLNEIVRKTANRLNSLRGGFYLISGQRGVGKSSIWEYIEEHLMANKHFDIGEDGQHLNNLIVPINFNKGIQDKKYIFRRLGRGLYFKVNSELAKDGIANDKYKFIGDQSKFAISKFYNWTSKRIIIDKINSKTHLNNNTLTFEVLPLLTELVFIFSVISSRIINDHATLILIFIVIILLRGILSSFVIRNEYKHQMENKIYEAESEIFDDEITEHRLDTILTNLSRECNLIFVLDEIDKIEKNQVNTIIKYFKSFALNERKLCTIVLITDEDKFRELFPDPNYIELSTDIANSNLIEDFNSRVTSHLNHNYQLISYSNYIQLARFQELYLVFQHLYFKGMNINNTESKEVVIPTEIRNWIFYLILLSNGNRRKFVYELYRNCIGFDSKMLIYDYDKFKNYNPGNYQDYVEICSQVIDDFYVKYPFKNDYNEDFINKIGWQVMNELLNEIE